MKPLESISTTGGLTPRSLFAAERVSQGGFELIFAEAQRRESTRITELSPIRNARRENTSAQAPAHGSQRAERPDGRPRNARRGDEAQPAPQEPNPATETEQPNAAYEAAPVTNLGEKADISNNGNGDALIPEIEILDAVAEILHVLPEAVQEMLARQNLQPQDLAEPHAVTALLQEALDAETPAALLTDPEFPAAYKAVNEAMAQLAQDAEANAGATQTATNTATTQNTNAATVSVSIVEGLQYATEDGQLVITDSVIDEEAVNAETPARQTTATPASETDASTSATGTTDDVRPVALEAAPLTTVEEVPADTPVITADPLANQVSARAQAVQTAQQTQTAQSVDPADVINQIMNQIRVHTGEQVTEMRLTLRPESLGDIVLRVLTQNGIVTAQFIAESQRVREALESSFNQLRDALREQGIQFSELSVSVRQDDNELMNQFEQGRQNTRNRAQRINDAAVETDEATAGSIDFDNTVDFTA